MHQWVASAIELLKNLGLIATRNADAMIDNFELDRSVIAIQLNAQKLVVGRVFERVVDQVNHGPCNGFAVNNDRRQVVVDFFFESKALLLDLITVRVECVMNQITDVGLAE